MIAPPPTGTEDPFATPQGKLYVYSGGFLTRRLRRILTLAGLRLTTGHPGPSDFVGVWGASPTARRGEAIATSSGATLLRIEDAFLRSVRVGRTGAPPLGLLIDPDGVHFAPDRPSRLERLLQESPLDDGAILQRARDGAERLRSQQISKYNAFDLESDVPDPGYVLVVDQTVGDASIRFGDGAKPRFAEMLAFAQIEHPGARIIIKTHPETQAGTRQGHFSQAQEDRRTKVLATPVSPWRLLEGAIAVYTMSSQLGFEAIMAGHRPRVFGQPWYGGWGLTEDEAPVPRRTRRLTRAQLFAGAMILAPTWYDPCRDRLCSFEEALNHLEAQVRAYREDRNGAVVTGMRLWKRRSLKQFYGREARLRFDTGPARCATKAKALGVPVLAWASQVTDRLDRETAQAHVPLRRIEDGFLRSRGLGAELVPPLSLVSDDLGIYYDPSQESRLERLIAERPALDPTATQRIERLLGRLSAEGLSKYNVGGPVPDLPEGRRILVPGQVEDDASIRLGCGEIRTNLGLLEAVRSANPEARILYKPHPDVEAGLRPGAVPADRLEELADTVLEGVDAAAALVQVDAVWTLTSGLGFEALLRGLPVTVLGAPFYAGWGLTDDRGPTPSRREVRPDIAAFAHAVLIAYPRYRDPVSGLPCSVEVVVERLASGRSLPRSPALRLLAKAQGVFATLGPFWR